MKRILFSLFLMGAFVCNNSKAMNAQAMQKSLEEIDKDFHEQLKASHKKYTDEREERHKATDALMKKLESKEITHEELVHKLIQVNLENTNAPMPKMLSMKDLLKDTPPMELLSAKDLLKDAPSLELSELPIKLDSSVISLKSAKDLLK